MKKVMFSFMVLSLIMMMGCSSARPNTTPVQQQQQSMMANYPQWVLDPSVEGGLGAVGIATIGKAGLQFSKTEAMANGRDALARIIEVKVKNMVKNFAEQTGVGDAQTLEKVSMQVSKQISSVTLKGSMQKSMFINENRNEIYVWIVQDPDILKKEIVEATEQAVKTSMRDDAAQYQQWKSENSQKELEYEVDKLNKEIKEEAKNQTAIK